MASPQYQYIDYRGSGGNGYDKGELKSFALPDTAPEAPAQLYNLKTDPGKTTNLYFKHPEIVKELKTLLERSKSGDLRNRRIGITDPEKLK